MPPVTETRKDLATRWAEAAQSGARAAGYCALEHHSGRASCTRTPGHDGPHRDYYNGRTSITDVPGTQWSE
ncbi:hypothetical protein LK07_18320 [Streptomyces pluripotens]|uniref:Uncharacterized protein n=1 Tax=Streptomyces pluripotens TaxID=1355015 RepID=A0A221P0T4_9ACTN|nr:hypothetical protein LK06_017165 [Streptomyces pluripotens]ASN25648.1 hypothetical protein LK07_18320 [Streptomyces pluripotens]KIE27732.1 hypothetical protein LK08_06645 [Streptomyces sp. MUSC 125]